MNTLNTIRENRRTNLRALVDAYTQVVVANRTGLSPGFLFQMTTDGKHKRGINDKNAQLIERSFGKPTGWMDQDHSDPKPFSNVVPAPEFTKRVPLISYVQAGSWSGVNDPYFLGNAQEWIMTDVDVSSSAFALKIQGDSMLPQFKEGDMVIIDTIITPQPGDFVIAKNSEEEATFKKYRPRGNNEQGTLVFELVALNPDFPTLRSDIDHCNIIGVMVEHRQFRKNTRLANWVLNQAETLSPPRNEKEQATIDILREMLGKNRK